MTKARDLANSADVFDTVTATELSYLDGVTSAIQTQLNGKQAVVANVDSTEIGYLDGVTSSIQTQLNSKAPTASPVFTGNVGIGGTATANAKLDVFGTNSRIRWENITTTATEISTNLAANAYVDKSSDAASHSFKVSGSERLNIASSGATTVAYTTTTGGAVRNIYMSTSTPSGGSDGDVWIQYA